MKTYQKILSVVGIVILLGVTGFFIYKGTPKTLGSYYSAIQLVDAITGLPKSASFYGGGIFISEKESHEYLKYVDGIINKMKRTIEYAS